MASGITISALSSLTTPADDDLFLILDSSEQITKNISKLNLFASYNSTIDSINSTLSNHSSRIIALENGGTGTVGYWTGSDGGSISRFSDVYVTGSFIVEGSLYANEKHFYIPHPTKVNKKLIYGTLEGPENSVYIRGRLTNSSVIYLPDYWDVLIDINSICVHLTSYKKNMKLYVKEIKSNKINIGKSIFSFFRDIDCFYFITAERKDIPKLQIEK